jgi:hypothetical protein
MTIKYREEGTTSRFSIVLMHGLEEKRGKETVSQPRKNRRKKCVKKNPSKESNNDTFMRLTRIHRQCLSRQA